MKIWKPFVAASGIGAFTLQLTGTDLGRAAANGAWGNAINGFGKIRYILSSVLYRTTGIATGGPGYGANAFYGGAPAINFSHAFVNQFTALGASLLGIGYFGKFIGLPHRGKLKTLGSSVLLGGFLGGLLDDPTGGAAITNPSGLNVATTPAFSGAVSGGGGPGAGYIQRSTSGANVTSSSGLNNR